MAGCSPIREGVLLIRPDTTLADVRKFGEECQRRWGITPLQIFLHKDEGHWLNGHGCAKKRFENYKKQPLEFVFDKSFTGKLVH